MSQSHASVVQNDIPAFGSTLREVDGVFASDSALQDAIGRLELAGFDRADLSLPHAARAAEPDTPEQGAENPDTEEDASQVRTLVTSLSGAVAAMATSLGVAAGDALVVPALAALAAGLGVTAVVEAVTRRGARAQHAHRESAASHGQLVLAVHLADPGRLGAAEQAMRDAGGTHVESIVRPAAAGLPVPDSEPLDELPVWIPGVRLAYRSQEWAKGMMH
jgi:hypothetical protein